MGAKNGVISFLIPESCPKFVGIALIAALAERSQSMPISSDLSWQVLAIDTPGLSQHSQRMWHGASRRVLCCSAHPC